jgi:hypothetical protein
LTQSSSGEFAFGFYPLQNNEKENQFLLAVWFNKIRDQNMTIVWSANGNKPAPQGSALKQNNNNEFVLNDPQGNELWKAPRNGSKSICVAIMDNGNLVILDENYNSIWESFKEPTDNFLPGQILGMPSTLRSRKSETDYSKGRFRLSLQTDGNLVLYSLSMPSEILEKAYFATMTINWNSQLIFTEAGYMYIQGGNGRTFNLTKVDPGSNETFYHIARIDYDGAFRLYKYLRKDDSTSASSGNCPSSWTEVQGIPDDSCAGGFCGPNSICNTSDGGTFCSYPVEFSPLYQSGYWAGCKPNFALPSCHDGWEANKELVDFKRLRNVDWPFSDYSLLQGAGVDEASCTQQCLDDCLCFVALYEDKGNFCWKMRYPLSNGIQSPNITRIALIKVPKDNGSGKKDRSTVVVVLAVLLGSSAFLNILFFLASSVAIY